MNRISYILPWFRKSEWFNRTVAWNLPLFAGHEVIFALDENSDERWLLHLISVSGLSKFCKVIVNDTPHSWRPPGKSINAAVRHATTDFIAVLSPETIVQTPLEYLPTHANMGKMLGGLLWNVGGVCGAMKPYEIIARCDHTQITNAPNAMGGGLFLAPKCAFEAIHGMDESRTGYGKDDDEIRIRLIRYGLKWEISQDIKLFHLWHEGEHRTPSAQHEPVTRNVMLDHQPNWGQSEVWRTAFDYTKI